jgi:hypothetical protein
MTKPVPTMVTFRDTTPVLRTSVMLTNEATVQALCEMASEEDPPVDAILKGLLQLKRGRDLLRGND